MAYFSSEVLNLISSLRGINGGSFSRPLKPAINIGPVIEKCFKELATPTQQKLLDEIQTIWVDLVAPISSEMCSPYKLDSLGCLWIRVKNSVLRQHLQFQEIHLLSKLAHLKVKSLRWNIR